MSKPNQTFGVYLLKTPNGSCYIGMTLTSFDKRWKSHLKDLKMGRHHSPGLTNAYQKYGWENISKIILESWPSNSPESIKMEVFKKELYWWNEYKNNGYSMLHREPLGKPGKVHTEESKRLLSEKMKTLIREGKIKPPPSNKQKTHKLTCKKCDNVFITKGASGKRRKICDDCHAKKDDLQHFKQKKKVIIDDVELKYYYNSGLSLREMATIFNCSHQTVKNRLIKRKFFQE